MTRSQESEVPAFSGLSYGLRNYLLAEGFSRYMRRADVVPLPGWMEHTNENSNFYLNPLRV